LYPEQIKDLTEDKGSSESSKKALPKKFKPKESSKNGPIEITLYNNETINKDSKDNPGNAQEISEDHMTIKILTVIMTNEEDHSITGETIIKDQETLVTPTIKIPNNTTTDTTTNNTSHTLVNPKDKTLTTKDKTTKYKINPTKTTATEITTQTQEETIITPEIDPLIIFVLIQLCILCFYSFYLGSKA
jgi:hypothetical protein